MGAMWRPELDWTYFMWSRLDLCPFKSILLSVLAAVSLSLARQNRAVILFLVFLILKVLNFHLVTLIFSHIPRLYISLSNRDRFFYGG